MSECHTRVLQDTTRKNRGGGGAAVPEMDMEHGHVLFFIEVKHFDNLFVSRFRRGRDLFFHFFYDLKKIIALISWDNIKAGV